MHKHCVHVPCLFGPVFVLKASDPEHPVRAFAKIAGAAVMRTIPRKLGLVTIMYGNQ